ncbi:hypothetical protein FRC03_004109 [Tulasnella sp. 419]|nr:hypothetical protein FRC02_008151 [Tulasnella sp. 418]KAG8970727.1 hypothetical protein FRC03_004109 [Tulasnella sp. 419]
MQPPTCTNVRIRSTADAHIIFHAVATGVLPIITRRLDTEERQELRSGNCYVWEERGSDSEATGMGIERWTDGQSWGPSRVREDFLFYAQREPHSGADMDDPAKPAKVRGPLKYGKRPRSQAPPGRSSSTTGVPSSSGRVSLQDQLVKQTYSVFTKLPDDPESKQPRKWHLTAYFTQRSIDELRTVQHIPELNGIVVPPDRYRSAKVGKKREPADVGPMPGTAILFRPDQDHQSSPTVPTLEPSNLTGIYQTSPSMSPLTSYPQGVAWPPSSPGMISAPGSAGPSRYSPSISYFSQTPHYPPESSLPSAPLPTHHREHSHPSLHGTRPSPRVRNLSMPMVSSLSQSTPMGFRRRQSTDMQMPDTPPDEHAALPDIQDENMADGQPPPSPGLVTMSERALPPLQFLKPDRLPARNPVDERALMALTGRFNR